MDPELTEPETGLTCRARVTATRNCVMARKMGQELKLWLETVLNRAGPYKAQISVGGPAPVARRWSQPGYDRSRRAY